MAPCSGNAPPHRGSCKPSRVPPVRGESDGGLLGFLRGLWLLLSFGRGLGLLGFLLGFLLGSPAA